jgi:STE24 endopeptidase
MNGFTVALAAALAASAALRIGLALRQAAYVRAHRDAVPEAFRDHVPLAVHRKAAGYTVAKARLDMAATGVEAVLLLAWTVGGGLALLDRAWRAAELPAPFTGAAVMASVLLLISLLRLPLSAYSRFVIDQRFGFNRTTPRLFLGDAVKSGLLLVAVTAPLAALALWLMAGAEGLRWLSAWAVWIGFVLLRTWAYPTLIAPLFNRFEPLRDGALRARIGGLVARCGLTLSGVLVMDGSRRSTHGNAYFTGIGGARRIVLLDTLVDSLEPDEIEAVLAHEAGHLKRRHVPKYLAGMGLAGLAGLALLGWLAGQPGFYAGLGVTRPSLHAALALLVLVLPVALLFLKPPLSALLRRFEYQADAFAARQTDPLSLARALVKLYRRNASTLTPDPVYSAFHHGHPPPLARLRRLSAAAPD